MIKVIRGAVLLTMIIAGPVPTMAMGTVGVGVSVPLPAPIGFAGPPALVVIPETYIYAVPDVNVDVFFYGGWWWRPWEGRWYRAQQYNSGWRHYPETPSFYRNVPPNWRSDYRQGRWRGNQWDRQRIPHQQVEQNWKSWESNQHWEKQNSWGVKGLKRPRTPSQEPSRRMETDHSRPRYKDDQRR